MAATPGVVGSTPVAVIGGHGRPTVAIASVYPKGSPQAASTTDLLSHVRNSVIPAATRGTGLTVLVGGTTAIFEDFSHILSAKLPLFIGVVVVLSFLLLMAVFRSLVIPLTAAVMNLLSAGAAFGIVTAIFQKGWLGGTTGPIETFVPVLMFPILFGLSMDYEVFLVSRIYEEWHRRRDNTEAVAHGLAATGRTITAAAAIMVLVFASFILGGERIIELFGVGLASAVLLDALIVRSVLVPALMILIGDANWKIPTWLNSSLPRLNVEGRTGHARGALRRGARARRWVTSAVARAVGARRPLPARRGRGGQRPRPPRSPPGAALRSRRMAPSDPCHRGQRVVAVSAAVAAQQAAAVRVATVRRVSTCDTATSPPTTARTTMRCTSYLHGEHPAHSSAGILPAAAPTDTGPLESIEQRWTDVRSRGAPRWSAH